MKDEETVMDLGTFFREHDVFIDGIRTAREKIEKSLLTDEEIREARHRIEIQIWSYGSHPMYEREKILLQVQLDKILRALEV